MSLNKNSAVLLAPLLYMAGIALLSSVPDTGVPASGGLEGVLQLVPPSLQNLLHVPLFGALAWLWWWALRHLGSAEVPARRWALGVTVAYGFLDEVHQAYVPGRFSSATDVALDAVGAVLVVVLLAWRERRTQAAGVSG